MAAYATVTQFLDRYDQRDVGALVSDNDLEVSRDDLLNDIDLRSPLQAALDDASGEIEAALLVGGQYSVSDLTGLTGNSAAYLTRITCDIAMASLFDRRPLQDLEKSNLLHERSEKYLDRLRKGENVLNVTTAIEAGTASITGPDVSRYDRLNLIPERARHYFPSRVTRVPTDRTS